LGLEILCDIFYQVHFIINEQINVAFSPQTYGDSQWWLYSGRHTLTVSTLCTMIQQRSPATANNLHNASTTRFI